jgi:predicted GNAT family N-acyltransferase
MSTHTPDSRVRQPHRSSDHVSPWIEVISAVSPDERLAALEIRRRVFSEEQGVADLRVADSDDARSLIALATFPPAAAGNQERRPVSTGRLTFPLVSGGQALVAWVATIPEARGQGAGGLVMRFLLAAADNAGAREVALAAQLPAEDFYRRLGFSPVGPLYDVRGMPHRRMVRLHPG